MKNIISKQEVFKTVNYAVKMIEKGENIILEIKDNFIKIIETKDGVINKFTYTKIDEENYKETSQFDVKWCALNFKKLMQMNLILYYYFIRWLNYSHLILFSSLT